MLAGKVEKDPCFEVARERNAGGHANGIAFMRADHSCVSVTYSFPKQVSKHKAEVLPEQPPVVRLHRLARIKRPRNKRIMRKWNSGENEGRSAAQVAEAWQRRQETGGNNIDKAYTKITMAPEDEGEDDAVTALAADFDGFLFPVFPIEKEDEVAVPAASIWGDEVEEGQEGEAPDMMTAIKEESEDSEYNSDDAPKKKSLKIKKAKTLFKEPTPFIKEETWD